MTLSHDRPGLVPGTFDLIELIYDRLCAGRSLDNPALTKLAEASYGSTILRGGFSPRDMYDAQETAVNKYLLTQLAPQLLEMDIDEAIGVLMAITGRLARQTDRTHEQVEMQQFSSPPALAYVAAKLLNVRPGELVCEPSAGTGSLAIWPRAMGASVLCNELAPRRAKLLAHLGFTTYQYDAEILHDMLPAHHKPTAFLMNPPFSATGGRVKKNDAIYGAKHVEHALLRLEPNGRLVAILGDGQGMGQNTDWWQRMMSVYNVRANFGIDGKIYAKYGTNVNVRYVIIDKSGPTPGDDAREQYESIVTGHANTMMEAWEQLGSVLQRPDQIEVAPDEEQGPVNSFVPYVVSRFQGGVDHPADIVETASMAAVTPPVPTYRPRLCEAVVSEGRLSLLQLERVAYAGQRHEQRLADGARGGFFLGDGTGVGKGRTLAGIIADNWNQGRKRAIWFSVNNDLMESTRRDLNALGTPIPLARINDYPASGEIALPEGVIFASYASLIAEAKTGERRLDQIIRWLGREGVIVLDEAHKAKNALAQGRGEPTQTGQAVIDLQNPELYPDYRIVYSSATGATDVRNMAYMTRLGLWGEGTAFPGGFEQFLSEVDEGGVGAMEMVSRDMKAFGMYASASISFDGVEYLEEVHRLSDDQRAMYDAAAGAWQAVTKKIDEALDVTGGGNRQKARAMMKFWGEHQRFFRLLICALKIPTILRLTADHLALNHSVVISLIGTGEARVSEQVARATAEGEDLEDLDFTPREVLGRLIEKAFPVDLYQDKTDPTTGKTTAIPVKDRQGNRVQSREALKMRQQLLDSLSALNLPENPLDQLINQFGEANVAELTGRKRRLIRGKNGKVEYKKRAPEGVAMSRVNVHEMAEFQAGRKRIAIISDAASMGISLHASKQELNQQRRVHITLELGWSADKQLQTFGRTHRTDQMSAPIYILLCTELGGEKRFCSTIARRLASLGALTKGDRAAANNGGLAQYNFETEEGKAALALMFRLIMSGSPVKGLENPKQTLRDMGLLVETAEGERIRREDETNITRFLNRVLALQVEQQNFLFDYYADLFEQTVRHAKANGTFNEGVTDIQAIAIRTHGKPHLLLTDAVTGARTYHHVLHVDRRVDVLSYDESRQLAQQRNGEYLRHEKKGHFILVTVSGRHTDPATGKTKQSYAVHKPEGARRDYFDDADLARWQAVHPEDARKWWETYYASLPKVETEEMHLIAGAIVPLWRRLIGDTDVQLRVVRVSTVQGQRIVGVYIPAKRLRGTLRSIGVGMTMPPIEQFWKAVVEQGDEIPLTDRMKLIRGKAHGEHALELAGAGYRAYDFEWFRRIGLINVQIKYQQRFFVPPPEEGGIAVLQYLLKRYPPIASTDSPEIDNVIAGAVDGSESAEDQALAPVIDVAKWIVPVEPPAQLALNEPQTTEQLAQVKRASARRPKTMPNRQSAAPLSNAAVDAVVAEFLQHTGTIKPKTKPPVEKPGQAGLFD